MSKATSFGNHLIKWWRERAGLSQRELAEILGVQASYVAYIEEDKRNHRCHCYSELRLQLALTPVKRSYWSTPNANHLLVHRGRPREKMPGPDSQATARFYYCSCQKFHLNQNSSGRDNCFKWVRSR